MYKKVVFQVELHVEINSNAQHNTALGRTCTFMVSLFVLFFVPIHAYLVYNRNMLIREFKTNQFI